MSNYRVELECELFCQCIKVNQTTSGDSALAQLVKALACKSADLRPVPGTHSGRRVRAGFPKGCLLTYTQTQTQKYPHTHHSMCTPAFAHRIVINKIYRDCLSYHATLVLILALTSLVSKGKSYVLCKSLFL